MNDQSSQQFESFVPVYDAIPDKWEDARPFVVEQLKKISNAINIREIGWYLDEELLSGKAFFPGANTNLNATPPQFRQILRKVIDIGGLPDNVTPRTVPHGIVFDANFSLIHLYGGATDPTSKTALQFGFAALPSTANIQLYIDQNNVIVSCGTSRTSYTRAYVVIEYIQEL